MRMVGKVLNERYELIAELGKGGMGSVYLARDKILGSYWAVKQVKNNKSVDVEAFKKEVELLSTLNYPDVPRIVDRIELGEDFFVVMDFIDGVSLSKKVEAEGPQPEKDVVEWAKLLCDTLDYLHTTKSNPIIYRDMKPDNIMLTKNGRVKLIDFGIAIECVKGQPYLGPKVGTKGYAAPEQYVNDVLDERTDIYSLGVTLYYLVTATTPGASPESIRPIREINPTLSEGLEYIIEKCTQADPKDRYQNCKELKRDLENINMLNSKYRKAMKKKLVTFGCSVLCFFISLSLTIKGKIGIEKHNRKNYQYAFSQGVNFEKDKNYEQAEKAYREAIEYNPDNVEAYLKLFNVLLPRDNDEAYVIKTQDAIDILRKYVEDKYCPVHNDPILLYQLSKKCLAVNNPTYAGYAHNYIEVIKKSNEYSNGTLDKNEIDYLEIIALNCSRDIGTQNFKELNEGMIKLQEYTDSANNMREDDKLDNYYLLMLIYNTYPDEFENSYEKIFEMGTKAKVIIDRNLDSDRLEFNNIIPMYELVASNLYNSAVRISDKSMQRERLKESLTWFGYLDDLNDDLSEPLKLKKGNAHKAIFDSYNNIEDIGKINDDVIDHLNKSITVFKEVLNENPENFFAAISITEAYLDMEMIKLNEASRDFTNTRSYYQKVLAIKATNKNLQPVELSRFSALKNKMKMAGIEE
ncbi:MAG: protein kinase [Clostridiales bacterium]|mgnify:CR=1 FL=1|nr:protein kinase [Clostridiales bacterium]